MDADVILQEGPTIKPKFLFITLTLFKRHYFSLDSKTSLHESDNVVNWMLEISLTVVIVEFWINEDVMWWCPYNTMHYNWFYYRPSSSSTRRPEVQKPRRRRCSSISEQLWAQYPYMHRDCLGWDWNPYSPRYWPTALTNRPPCLTCSYVCKLVCYVSKKRMYACMYMLYVC